PSAPHHLSLHDALPICCSNSGTEQTSCESVDPGNASDANASNFYLADVTENQDLTGGASGVSATNGGTLKMNNLSSSQDSCKNADRKSTRLNSSHVSIS